MFLKKQKHFGTLRVPEYSTTSLKIFWNSSSFIIFNNFVVSYFFHIAPLCGAICQEYSNLLRKFEYFLHTCQEYSNLLRKFSYFGTLRVAKYSNLLRKFEYSMLLFLLMISIIAKNIA